MLNKFQDKKNILLAWESHDSQTPTVKNYNQNTHIYLFSSQQKVCL